MPDASAPATVARLPWGAITPCPLNQRKTFDEEQLAELSQSIAQRGILENLVVRPLAAPLKNMPAVTHELLAGERRWRAYGLLVKAGTHWPEDELPVKVLDVDDVGALEIMLIENTQRADLHPLEEGTTFKALHDRGVSCESIGEKIGKTKRHVERRIALIEKLDDKVKQAFVDGEINLAQARAMTSGDGKFQAAILADVRRAKKEGYGEEDVTADAITRRLIDDAARPLKHALFARELYTGEVIVDEDDGSEHALDAVQYDKLQKDALAEKVAELKKEWKFVEVLGRGSYFSSYDWETSKDKSKAGCVIVTDHEGKVTVHSGLVKRGSAAGSGHSPRSSGRTLTRTSGAIAAEPAEPTTKAHNVHAQGRKTMALQSAVADSPRAAKILLCLALADDEDVGDDDVLDNVRIFRASGYDAKSHPVDARVEDAVAAWALPHDGLKRYAAIAALVDEQLDNLLAALVARQVRTWVDYSEKLGDSELAIRIAKDLGIAGNEAKHGLTLQAEDLEGLRKPALQSVSRALGIQPLAATGKKMIADILNPLMHGASGTEAFVLPSLTFGSEEQLTAALVAGAIAEEPKKKPEPAPAALPERAAAGKKKPGMPTKGATKAERDAMIEGKAKPAKKAAAAKKPAAKKAAKPKAKKAPAKKKAAKK